MSKQIRMSGDLAPIAASDLEKVAGGLIGPDQDLSSFPRWVWPYIRPADFISKLDAVALNPQPLPPQAAIFGQ